MSIFICIFVLFERWTLSGGADLKYTPSRAYMNRELLNVKIVKVFGNVN